MSQVRCLQCHQTAVHHQAFACSIYALHRSPVYDSIVPVYRQVRSTPCHLLSNNNNQTAECFLLEMVFKNVIAATEFLPKELVSCWHWWSVIWWTKITWYTDGRKPWVRSCLAQLHSCLNPGRLWLLSLAHGSFPSKQVNAMLQHSLCVLFTRIVQATRRNARSIDTIAAETGKTHCALWN